MSSRALVTLGTGDQQTHVDFVQQGQVDWILFGRTVYSASLAVMQRHASCGIQPVTYGAGLALASRFNPSPKGRERMDNALQNLEVFPGFDKVLYFGFGVQSFVRLLAQRQIGVNCIALCSCLVDTHNEELSARVLQELWDIQDFPNDYKPSYAQFLALVKACAGVITGTTFGETVSVMLGEGRKKGLSLTKGASGAQDIAKALNGLFQISRGVVENITIIGGLDCAFIAALAHWIFSFSTHEDIEGNLVFMGGESEKLNMVTENTAQVTVRYGKFDRSSQVQLERTTYILGDYKEMLIHMEYPMIFDLVARVPWNSCLSRVYGSAFAKLLDAPRLLGRFLGGASRLSAGLACSETDVAGLSRENYTNFVPASYGKGFIQSIGCIFPELQRVEHLANTMQHALQLSMAEAVKSIEDATFTLKAICGCIYCGPKHPESDEWGRSEIVCAVAVASTILRLASILACIDFDSNIQPTLSGLELFGNQAQLTWRSRHDWEENFLNLMVYYNNDSQKNLMMDDIHTIFIGTAYRGYLNLAQPSPSTVWTCCTASSQGGVCIYLDALRSLSSRAESMRLLHVRRGHIEWVGKRYDSVWDGFQLGVGQVREANIGMAEFQNATVKLPNSQMALPSINLKGLVSERATGDRLHFYYRATTSTGLVNLQPGMLTESILKNTGTLSCKQERCNERLAFPCTIIQKGWLLTKEQTRGLEYRDRLACCIWTYKDDIARCMAIALHEHLIYNDIKGAIFIRSHECLACSTQSVIGAVAKSLTGQGCWKGYCVAHIV